jgi:hypothetical protein
MRSPRQVSHRDYQQIGSGAIVRIMTLIRKFVSFKRESSEARKTDFCPPRTEIPHENAF